MILQSNYLLILISAIITGLSQHFPSFGFLCWFSLVPFIKILYFEYNRIQLIKYSFLWGVVYNLIVVYWLATNIGTTPFIAFVVMLLTIFILSFNTIFIVVLWMTVRDYIQKYDLFFLAVFWVVIEFLRSYGLLGFPWISLANTQTNYLYLIQNVEYVGIYGITFWILFFNIFIFKLLYSDLRKPYAYYYILLLLLPWVSGYKLYSQYANILPDSNNSLNLLVIQPNISLSDKNNPKNSSNILKTIIDSTINNISKKTQLVVWPESAMPYHSVQSQYVKDYLNEKLFVENFHLLTGNIIHEDFDIYNSSILLNKNEIKGAYNKRQLVPLAEHFPFSDNFDFLKNINLGQANFSKGKEDYVFGIDEFRFASLICIESTFPDINRRHANMSVDAMIYLVNDGWYLTSPEPRQHARQSIFRAIENRIPVIRCANTGISQIINPLGIVEKEIELNKFGTINVQINKNIYKKTFYTRFGNIFSLILLVLTILVLILSRFKNEKK